jgi:signal transduction histidine kinase
VNGETITTARTVRRDPRPEVVSDARYVRGMEHLVSVVQELSLARTLDALMATVRRAARELTGADGATFVLRDGEFCHYVDEDAISPLWKGSRFPLDRCVSGWAMRHREPVAIEDISADPRVPVDAYRPTFVKSLVMVPIRTLAPVGAIGNYWADRHRASAEEVRLLGALADSTSIALENVQLYADLERRVAERTAALAASQEELAAKHDALLQARRRQEEMAALVVHDLKSPASGIMMICRAKLRGTALAESDRRPWHSIQAAAEVINRLALNLLDVARTAEGTLRLAREAIDVAEMLGDVVDSMAPLVGGFGQRLVIDADGAAGRIDGDRELLSRVFQNLIDNAIRHGAIGATVALVVRADGADAVEIRVTDEGSGIPAAMRDTIFDKYARVDGRTDARHATGRGLGLAFCRLAIDAHGGRITVADNVPHGTVFTVVLPRGPSSPAA